MEDETRIAEATREPQVYLKVEAGTVTIEKVGPDGKTIATVELKIGDKKTFVVGYSHTGGEVERYRGPTCACDSGTLEITYNREDVEIFLLR